MMIEEFEKRIGIFPDMETYRVIETYYYEFDGDKDAFCKAFKANKNGLAEQIQREVNSCRWKAEREVKAEEARLTSEIEQLKKELERTKADLDREQEWKPYNDTNNVPQADYEKLAKDAELGLGSHYMTDDEAIHWICDEFDFDPSKITIIHEIDEYEINRHRQLRKTGRKIDRRPVYCATDYHYIRFNTSRWYYEVWNDQLRPFYC